MENSKEPWELRSDDTRIEDKLPTFIIFTEDKVSERVYFKSFETDKMKVNAIGNQKSKIANVINAITHCQQNALFDESDNVAETGLQVWCVFDRDYDSDSNETAQNDTSFDESLRTAEGHNIKVAWSNDCFELWILLHYEDINHTEQLLRDKYYERLTKIMEADVELSKNFSKAIDTGHYNYKECFKRESNFKNHILPILQDKTRRTAAIERAKALENHHKKDNVKPHKMCPCTMVHHLVEELLQCQQIP
ncbi:MAG: RloB family protein [Prevotella intermedia]